jgi:hypothetical protein
MITCTETPLELATETSANHGCPDSFLFSVSDGTISGVQLPDLDVRPPATHEFVAHPDEMAAARQIFSLDRQTEMMVVSSRTYELLGRSPAEALIVQRGTPG